MKHNDTTCTLYIGKDKKIWDEFRNSIVEATLFFRYIYGITCLSITLADTTNSVGKKYDLSDGQLLTLIWGKGSTNTFQFRIARIKRSGLNNVFSYEILAYMNEIAWFLDGTTKSYNQNSSEAITQIAKDCNLESDVDKTNDKRIWYGNADRNFVAARKFAQRGFINDKSLMALCFMPGLIRYKDLNQIDVENPLAIFGLGIGGKTSILFNEKQVAYFSAIDCKILDSSGIFNLKYGYKTIYDDASIERNGDRKNFDKIQVRNRVGYVSFNQEIADQIEIPRQTASKIRTDNSHQNQGQAQYQNKRGINVLSNSGIAITTTEMTNLAIFDPIYIQISKSGSGVTIGLEEGNKSNDGPYILMSKNIRMSGGTYAEKLIAFREGTIR